MNWIKRWAGSYTFISCSYWGRQYSFSLKKSLGEGFDRCKFIHEKGVVIFLLPQDEFEKFGKAMAKKVDNNEHKPLLEELKNNTDKLNEIMNNLEGKIPSLEDYNNFLKYFEKHLALHNFMKKTVDFLSDEKLEEVMDDFKEARLYSEPIYSRTEKFFREFAKAVSKKENIDENYLTCLTQDELEGYIENNSLPNVSDLEKRYNGCVLNFENEKLEIDFNVDEIKNSLSNKGEIVGVVAYPGKVKGICRIIKDPHNVKVFNEGDILITGMTRPEFLPLVEKASAIVTDVGGKLCHAAISAREFKIPCIIGTENATSLLKDGDLIEVDADNGKVEIF